MLTAYDNHLQSLSCQHTPSHHTDIPITIVTIFYSLNSYAFLNAVLLLLSLNTLLSQQKNLSRHTVLHSITYRYKFTYTLLCLFLFLSSHTPRTPSSYHLTSTNPHVRLNTHSRHILYTILPLLYSY